MIQNELYLAHHGILGQKWGKKNGPPYPLDYKKLSPEERQLAKKNAIERGDIKEAQFNKQYWSSQEINDVINRFNTEQRLNDLNASTVKSGKSTVEKILSSLSTTQKLLSGTTSVFKAAKEFSKIFEAPEDKDKTKDKVSFTDKELEEIVKDFSKYSDQEVKDMSTRAENIGKIKGAKERWYKS